MVYTTCWKFSARTLFNMPRLQLCSPACFRLMPPPHTHSAHTRTRELDTNANSRQDGRGHRRCRDNRVVCVVLSCAGGDSLGITCQLESKQATSRLEVSKVSGGEESVCVCVCNIFYCEAVSQS